VRNRQRRISAEVAREYGCSSDGSGNIGILLLAIAFAFVIRLLLFLHRNWTNRSYVTYFVAMGAFCAEKITIASFMTSTAASAFCATLRLQPSIFSFELPWPL
jgi:hypothetical protein